MVLTQKQNPPIFSKLGQRSSSLPNCLEGQRWYVAVTKPRCEKKVAWHLFEHSVSFFLPMQVERSATNGKVHKLIFDGFCFFLGYPTDLYTAWDSRRVKTILKTDNQFELRRDLRDVARVVRSGIKLVKNLEAIQIGRRVKIIHGHVLAGMEAKVDLRKNNRVWLDVQLVGSRSFEIDANFLEVIK